MVKAGEVGVVEFLGRVEEDTLKPGLHFVHPFSSVTKFDTQKQTIRLHCQNRTKGGVFVDVEMVVVFRLDPEKVKDIYTEAGNRHDNFHVKSKAACVLQSVVGRNRVDDVHKTHRIGVGKQVQKQLSEDLQKYGILVDQVVIENVQLPDYFTSAIQELHKLDLAMEAEKRKTQLKMIQAKGVVDRHKMSKIYLDTNRRNNTAAAQDVQMASQVNHNSDRGLASGTTSATSKTSKKGDHTVMSNESADNDPKEDLTSPMGSSKPQESKDQQKQK